MGYPHILSPIQIGNVTLKSRLLSAKCVSYQQNDFEAAAAFYENFAKKGAATVTVAIGTWPDCQGKRSQMSKLHMEEPETQEGFRMILDRIHRQGSLASAMLMNIEPQDVAISDTPNWNEIPMTGDYSKNFSNKPGITREHLEGMIQDYISQSVKLKELGFDMVTIYMSYRGGILACSLSPVLNQRTDKYGGKTMQERATLTLEIFRGIKEACGQDFLIEAQISAEEEAPGYTVEDFLEYCKLCEGLVDIFQIRGWEGSTTHLNGYNCPKGEPLNLRYAEMFKKAGIHALVSPVGGFVDLDDIEQFLAEGRTDLVSIARGFLADEEYGEKLRAGRGQDLTPCLLCNGCHGGTCAVNPMAGYTHIPVDRSPTKHPKKVAVLGGGAAGIRAAIWASEKGHQVTLYEKGQALGGQLNCAQYPKFKWPLNDYRLWLLRQLRASNVQVLLQTEATPELLEGKYDAIFVALGSVPKTVPVPGADGQQIWNPEAVYGHEQELGHRVVVVGGGSTGRETALYLAQCGHEVTMLTRSEATLFEDMHARRACEIEYEKCPNFHYYQYAATQEIGPGYVVAEVTYGMPSMLDTFGGGKPGAPGENPTHDPEEMEHMPMPEEEIPTALPTIPNVSTYGGRTPDAAQPRKPGMSMFMQPVKVDESKLTHATIRLEYDSIVVSGGRTPRKETAQFAALAPEVYVLGDNVTPGNVKECTETAFAAVRALDQ